MLIVFFFATLGPPGTLLIFVMWVGYAIAAQSILSADYLRKGWVRSGDYRDVSDRPDPNWMAGKPAPKASAATVEAKTCPFCAETVKAAAIKCKHCGSELPALSPAVAREQVMQEPVTAVINGINFLGHRYVTGPRPIKQVIRYRAQERADPDTYDAMDSPEMKARAENLLAALVGKPN